MPNTDYLVSGGWPDREAFEPRTKADMLDLELSWRKRAIAYKEAKEHIRTKIADERAKAWWDKMGEVLGPTPTTAEEWAARGVRVLEYALVQGAGIDPAAARAYAQECDKRAAWLEPQRYGDLKMIRADVQVRKTIDSSVLSAEERDALRSVLRAALERSEAEDNAIEHDGGAEDEAE